jgi:hypothetical protein
MKVILLFLKRAFQNYRELVRQPLSESEKADMQRYQP